MTFLADFRADPVANPLPTPSGRIEIVSETIAAHGDASCGGHARWYSPADDAEHVETKTLHLVSDQPARRLHSQLDHAAWSRAGKRGGREPVLLHSDDARDRGIEEGDAVRLSNARGACLASATLTDGIVRGAARLSTGAWFDPAEGGARLDRHGNPNVLTRDLGASSLSQGCAAQTCRVRVERIAPEDAPRVAVFDLPRLLPRAAVRRDAADRPDLERGIPEEALS